MLLFGAFTSKVTDVLGWLTLCTAARSVTLLISIAGKPGLVMTVTAHQAWARHSSVAVRGWDL